MGAQETDGQAHDGGFVQVGAHAVRQGQLMGQLIEDFCLFTPPASGSISGLLLPPLRATPECRREGSVPEMSLSPSHMPGQDIPRTPDCGAARPSRRADAAPPVLQHTRPLLSVSSPAFTCVCALNCLPPLAPVLPGPGLRVREVGTRTCRLISWQCLRLGPGLLED